MIAEDRPRSPSSLIHFHFKTAEEASAFGEKYTVEYVLTDNESERGDSGAPVVTDTGCLAGILNGGNGEYSALTFLPEDILDDAGL